jgi:hypothetical protein
LISVGYYGGGLNELANAIGNVLFSISTGGQLQSNSNGTTGSITGDPKGVGFGFLVLNASINSAKYSNSPGDVGHKTSTRQLDYTSFDQGTGTGEYRSDAIGTAPATASLSSNINAKGKSILVLTDGLDFVWDSVQDFGFGSGPTQFHTDEKDNSKTTLTSRYTAGGNLGGSLATDDSVDVSGSAGDSNTFTVDYTRTWKRTDSAQSGNPSSNYLYVQERNADFNAQLTESTSMPLNSATVTTTITRSGDPHVVAWSTGAGNQELANSFESHLEAIITGISPPELQNWSGTAGSIVSQKPSTSYLMEAISWFGGTAGDSADRAMNFTTGVGDAMSCNLGYGIRSSLGIDYTNYDGDYNGGQIVGTVAGVVTGGPALVKGAAQGAKAIASGAQNLTKCGTALGKLIRNSCFVAGTLVNLSSLPRDLESESNLWSNDDWDMRSNEEDGTSTTSVLRFSAIAAPSRILIPIEQVPLGARVPTKNPRPWEYDDSLPDPIREQWARIELTYEGDDGRITDIELLRPKTWVQSNEVFPNATVFINMPELKVKGLAYVRAIEACPVIADGSGSVVTARFATRSVSKIARAEINGADGAIEVIEGTPNHPFWSLDRNDWVPLGELEEGEHLRGEAGVAFVLTHVIVNRSVPVYNIEVHGEHVYQVGNFCVLVHNTCSEYNGAMTEALTWLGSRGFDASKAIPTASKWSTQLNGLKQAGNIGYRIEHDLRSGAHINVFAGKSIGPHFKFSGNQADVAAILRQLFGG